MAKKVKWFEKKSQTGWEKDQPENVRRRKVLKAHKGSELAAGRSMQALANVTQDKETARVAGIDAMFFFEQHRMRKLRRKPIRVTPKRPALKRS